MQHTKIAVHRDISSLGKSVISRLSPDINIIVYIYS